MKVIFKPTEQEIKTAEAKLRLLNATGCKFNGQTYLWRVPQYKLDVFFKSPGHGFKQSLATHALLQVSTSYMSTTIEVRTKNITRIIDLVYAGIVHTVNQYCKAALVEGAGGGEDKLAELNKSDVPLDESELDSLDY